MLIRCIPAEGETLEEMRQNARRSDLAKEGDMELVWVNAGDLSISNFQQLLPAGDGQIDGACEECGLTGPCMMEDCRHPLARAGTETG